jgi:hypothetical protein
VSGQISPRVHVYVSGRGSGADCGGWERERGGEGHVCGYGGWLGWLVACAGAGQVGVTVVSRSTLLA